MQKRTLGTSQLSVTPLAFGGNVFGWTIDSTQSFRMLDAFVSSGGNLIDTADIYSAWAPGHKGGESESIIGDWLKKSGKRNDVLIATKVGMEVFGQKGLSKKHILEAVDGSLQRLQTDVIDLYQSHADDLETPLEETLSAYDLLIKQGKVKYIGASNYTAPRLKEALRISKENGLASYQTLQPLYNLTDRTDFEGELQKVCVENNVGVIPYFSLAAGFLTGKYRTEADFSKSKRGAGMKKYLDARGLRILKALDQVSEEKRATPAQVALAWLMTRPAIAAPIASATTPEQFADIVKALTLTLDKASLEVLDTASAK